MAVTLHTVGHSTHSESDFRALLVGYGIEKLVDVRQFPGSRRFPHFSAAALAASLAEAGIAYVHEVDLGGRRRAAADSPNTYWTNPSFRAFADHMSSSGFQEALERTIDQAKSQATAIMCAEAVPWRCHRWLISDALSLRGFEVIHIIDPRHSQVHKLNPNACIDSQGRLIYPGPVSAQKNLPNM